MREKDQFDSVFHVLEYETVSSTNTELFKLAEAGAEEWTVMVAHAQTAGKGRLGRHFSSPSHNGVYFSVLLRPKVNPEKNIYITVAAAVAAAKAIEKISGVKAGIKWVNDIFVRNKKVCGILAESKISDDAKGMDFVVLGIGVNLTEPENGFPEEIRDTAGAVFADGCDTDRKSRELVEAFLREFYAYYTKGLESSFDEYKKRSVLTGKKIQMIDGNNIRTGTVLGIDSKCALLVRYEDGTEEAHRWGSMRIKVLYDQK